MDICDDFLTTLPLQPPGMLLADGHLDFMDMDDEASVYSSELLDDGYMSPMYNEQPHQHPTSSSGSSTTSSGSRSHNNSNSCTIKTEPVSSYSSDESVDLNEFQTINPDDFLSDLFKSEVKHELDYDQHMDGGMRQTPSPSASHSSSTGSTGSHRDYNDYRIEMPTTAMSKSTTTATATQYALETPPVSPPSPGGGSTSSSSSHSSTNGAPLQLQHSTITAPAQHIQYAQAIPVVQGTLIPITAIPMSSISSSTTTSTTNDHSSSSSSNLPVNFKRIRIQPKPPAASGVIPASINGAPLNLLSAGIRKPAGPPKRIILSAQDYTALMQKCKTQPAAGITVKPITIKAAPPQQPVLMNRVNAVPVAVLPSAAAPQMPSNQPAVHQATTLSAALAQQQRQQQQQPIIQQIQTAGTPLLMSGQLMQPNIITIPASAQVVRIAPHSVATPVALNTPAAIVTSLPPPPPHSQLIRAQSNQLPRVAPKTGAQPRVEVEDKLHKKHQRMIKNRESACLSRKKKKDYMTALEQQIAELGDENTALRTQNTFLRDRIQQLEQLVCACGKAAERQTSAAVRLLPSVQRNKKNAVFLLAVVFMVSLNFGPNILGGGTLDTALQQSQQASDHHQARHLLWVDEEVDNRRNGTPIDSRARVTNGSMATLPTFMTAQTPEHANTSPTTNTQAPPSTGDQSTPYPMCPLYVNQTENVRLASELRRWIGDLPQYLNINATNAEAARERGIDLNTISNYLLNDDTIRSLFRQLRTTGDKTAVVPARKRTAAISSGPRVADQADDVAAAAGVVGHVKRRTVGSISDVPSASNNATDHNRLQLYDPVNRDALKYAELIEQLRRQDDTFYVVSFSGDHLLLPALAHNKTYRPKMSLMLPSVGINATFGASEFVTLMQIDCEVVNTSLIQIKEKLIPRHLRSKSATATKKGANYRGGSAANRTASSGGGGGSAKRRQTGIPLPVYNSKQPSAAPGFNETANAYNQTSGGYEDFHNGTAGGYNVTAGGKSEEFAYTGQYKPYFVDKTRDKRDQFKAGP